MSLATGEFTNAGKELLNRAQNGEILTITKIVVGSGAASVPSDLWPLTALIVHEMDVNIVARSDDGAGTLLVEGNFKSSDAPHSFFLREVGVMARIGTGTEQLYSVANVFADPPDFIDPAAPTLQAFKLKLIIDRIPSGSLVVTIAPTAAVTGENEGTGKEVYKETAGNVLKFRTLVAGAGVSLDYSDDDNSVIVGASELAANVDIYVPTSYPSPPPGAPLFDTIQQAHDYLLQFRIPAALTATIHVWKGTFNITAPIVFSHPDSRQIHVLGQARVDKTVAGITFVSSTQKRLDIADVTGLANGQFGYVALGHPAYSGGCVLNAVPTAHNVAVSQEHRGTRALYSGASTGAPRFSYLPTVIISTQSPSLQQGVFHCLNGIGSIENIFVKGGWACFNISDGLLKNVQAWGAARGINSGAGSLQLVGECVITQCDFGITGFGVLVAFDQTYVNACTQGITPSQSGFAIGSLIASQTTSLVYIAYCQYGANANGGGVLEGGSHFCYLNDFGYAALINATMSLAAAIESILSGNGTDLFAQGMSYIEFTKHGGAAPSCNPAAEAAGNQNAFIHLLP